MQPLKPFEDLIEEAPVLALLLDREQRIVAANEAARGYFNIDPALVAAAVTERTKAVLPVDLAGQPADLDPLLALGIPIVEDAAHAAESRYRGRKIGSIADITCFSLYATKNIAAGEGGLIATNRGDVAQAVLDLRLMRRGDGSLYDIPVPGYKANLSDVLAAIALCQLDKVERHTRIRQRQFAAYDEAVAGLAGITPLARDDRDVHALHLYVVRIDAEAAGATRDQYQHALAEENIATSIHFLPVHKLTYYRERFAGQPPLPVAERLPADPTPKDEQAGHRSEPDHEHGRKEHRTLERQVGHPNGHDDEGRDGNGRDGDTDAHRRKP